MMQISWWTRMCWHESHPSTILTIPTSFNVINFSESLESVFLVLQFFTTLDRNPLPLRCDRINWVWMSFHTHPIIAPKRVRSCDLNLSIVGGCALFWWLPHYSCGWGAPTKASDKSTLKYLVCMGHWIHPHLP
jgi:hypothetical protein